MAELTSDDEGKGVVAANGTELGHVDRIEDGTLYVSLNDGIEVNWGETTEGTYALGKNTVESVDEEEVRLRGKF